MSLVLILLPLIMINAVCVFAVFGYEVWMSGNPSALNDDLDVNNTTSLLDLNASSNMKELLQEAGEEITLELHIEERLKADTLYFLALRAVDDTGNKR